MNSPRFAFVCAVLLGASACPSQTAPTPTKAKAANAATPGAGGAQAKAPAGPPAPTTPDAKTAGNAPGPAGPAQPVAVPGPTQSPPTADNGAAPTLGAQFADPRWFRKTMFGDKGSVLDTKRSQADEQGRFSSLIRFDLGDMTIDACADHLEELVKGDIADVQRAPEGDGRVKLTGSNEQYRITFMCGQAEGKTIAYVSFAWT